MNRNHFKIQSLKKLTKHWAICCALFCGLLPFFYSPKTPLALALPDCSTISGTAYPGGADHPGAGDCVFFSPLPLCKNIPYPTYNLLPSAVLSSSTIAKHRQNCADLSDLPLCSELNGNPTSSLPGKNCVKECTLANFPDQSNGTRGLDYAVHNRDCVRFRDAPEASFTATLDDSNSVKRNCHQLSSLETPVAGTNCDVLDCNLLTPDELNNPKFDDTTTISYACSGNTPNASCNKTGAGSSCDASHNCYGTVRKKYCDGSTVKCYNFTEAQLPYVKSTIMCQLHQCTASSSTCIPANDGSNVSQKGVPFTRTYKHFVMGLGSSGTPATDASLDNYGLDALCLPILCKPIIRQQFRCTNATGIITDDNATATVRNSNCDSVGDGSLCISTYCYKTIDCNSTSNPNNTNEPMCQASTPSSDDSIGSTNDVTNAWFYRPMPMPKSTTGGILLSQIEVRGTTAPNEICISQSAYEALSWGSRPSISFGALGTLEFGLFHYYLSTDPSRSPGLCGESNDGLRGNGYNYLCGTEGSLYNKAPDYAAYHKGYVNTTYTNTEGTHKLVVAVRFKNSMTLAFLSDDPSSGHGSCGKRECGIGCSFGICAIMACGFDVERELTVNNSNPMKCAFNSDDFAKNDKDDIGCAATIDTASSSGVRIRAVKYGNKICTFLDSYGQFAYNGMFFNGTEKLGDGVTCVSGVNDGTGTCSGSYNTNDSKWRATRWRTIIRIPYIKSNRPSAAQDEPQGYLDKNGELFREQDCIKVPYRVTQPRMYNLATLSNSSRLFVPPISIVNSYKKKGGIVSTPKDGEDYGKTDFHYPEIGVRFGAGAEEKFSLDLGCIGDEANGSCFAAAINNTKTLTTTVEGIPYSVNLIAKKELNRTSNTPLFCLYQKTKDVNGLDLPPLRIGCVDRELPEINNLSSLDPSINLGKVIITDDQTNTYDDSKINFKYLYAGANRVSNNCTGDDSCTSSITITNREATTPTCNKDLENYQICAQRENCSRLNIECVKNGINIQAAINAGTSTAAFDAIKADCEGTLLSNCNKLKGISTENPSGVSNAYGWFNELCISSGFESKLKNVIAYLPDNHSILGKCKIDLVHKTAGANCSAGGKAPDCPCIEAAGIDEASLAADEVIRKQTIREAGLCIDMPLPKMCDAINYNTSPNSDSLDPDYINSSVNQTRYCTSSITQNCVDASHKRRSDAAIHSQFSSTPIGMVGLSGNCVGFWKKDTNLSGVSLSPKINCSLGNDNLGHWGSVANECVRYYCPAITTNGPDANGNYDGSYSGTETGENKGLFHGFATWNSYLKTNDFLEETTANACIIGFKKSGAMALANATTLSGSQAIDAAISNLITGYSGGSLPKRNCNQLGQWQASTSSPCQRITCPEISRAAGSLPTPTNSTDNTNWAKWNASGGAEFLSPTSSPVKASRSTERIQTESYGVGICNNNLGYFQIGSTPPTRGCNALGNWETNVINPCQVGCVDIQASVIASNPNNGFSYWNAVNSLPNGQTEIDQTSTQCVPGYVPYPYPPYKDKYGNALSASVANDLTRSATYPQRVCKQKSTYAATLVNLWTPPSSSCINTCPGASYDGRIGVGITEENTSAGKISISWPNNTALGDTAYISTPSYNQQDASLYFNGRTNHTYILARHCGTDGKWGDVIPQCSTKNGEIAGSHAFFDTPTNYIPVGSITTARACATNYTINPNLPRYNCSYKDANNNIDEVYYALASGSTPCVVTCQATSSQSFGIGAVHSGGTIIKKAGENLFLSCRNGFGSIIGGTSVLATTANQKCGATTAFITNRTTLDPYVTCNNGEWSSVYNDCSECRGCDIYSPIAGTTSGSAYVDCSSCCTDSGWTAWYDFTAQIQTLSLSNLASTTLIQTGVDGRYCGWDLKVNSGTVTKTVMCFDGTKYGQ